MELAEVQARVDDWIRRHGGYWDKFQILSRLTEELGEVSAALQRSSGLRPGVDPATANVGEEIGDLLFTLAVLAKLGITLKERLVDFALYRSRLEQYDYDMVVIVEGTFTLPSAATQAALYGSKSADEQGNSNFRGVKSPAIDAIIAAMGRAQTLEELRDAARAMDRVVMWNFWQIPDLWASREPISYWDKFARPEVLPPYFGADTLISGFVEHGPWPLWTWWDKSLPLKAA